MALRICTRQWDLSCRDLLLNSKILTLAAQQEYLSLCTFYKIIHNQMFFPLNTLHFKKPVSLRSTLCLKLQIIFHPTFVFFNCGTTSPYILCRAQHFLSSRNYFWITCIQYMYDMYRYCVDLVTCVYGTYHLLASAILHILWYVVFAYQKVLYKKDYCLLIGLLIIKQLIFYTLEDMKCLSLTSSSFGFSFSVLLIW